MTILSIIWRVFKYVSRDPVVSSIARHAVRQATAAIIRSVRRQTPYRKGTERVN